MAALLALVRMPWPSAGTGTGDDGPDGPSALLASVCAAAGSGGLRKKLNKWVKACLKFALHASVIVDCLCELFQAARVRPGDVDAGSPWGALFAPTEEDFYHPATALQMVVGHSKFPSALRGGRQKHASNVSLLRLLVLLLSGAEPTAHTADLASLLVAHSPTLAPADHFLVVQLARMYHGTMGECDRLVLRALHLLHAAGRGPPPFSLAAQGPAARKGDVGTHPVLSALSQGVVYATLAQWPQWRSFAPQPLREEGSDAEAAYRQGWLGVVAAARDAWRGASKRGDAMDVVEDGGEDDDGADGADADDESVGSDDSRGSEDSDRCVFGPPETGRAPLTSRPANHSWGSDSIKSIAEADGAAGLGDFDDAVPWVDDGVDEGRDGGRDKEKDKDKEKEKEKEKEGSARVYDPCYWLPALHHALMQVSMRHPHSPGNGQLSTEGVVLFIVHSPTPPLLHSSTPPRTPTTAAPHPPLARNRMPPYATPPTPAHWP